MLEVYQSLLIRLRQDKNAWQEVAHRAIYHEDKRMEDLHYRQRYGVLLCLQYDRRDEDHTLVRYLLEEEIKSRRNDPFQGESSALLLAAFLLGCFNHVEDVWLLWRAKSANFDTFFALEHRHLFAAGIEATLRYVQASDRPEAGAMLHWLREETPGPGVPTPAEMEQFRQQQQQNYPADPSQEETLTLVDRAWELDQIEAGRRLLDSWEACQQVTDQMLSTLMHARDRLGQPEQALACAYRLLEMAGTDARKRDSAEFNVGRFAVKAGAYEQAWQMLAQILESFYQHPERDYLGQHLAILNLTIGIGQIAPPTHPLRHEALQKAHALIEQGFSTSYNVLKEMSELARTSGDTALERRYQALAATERRRIDRQIAGDRP